MVMLMQETIRYMIPMMLVALAGVYAERSGIINLALEGIMVIGAVLCSLECFRKWVFLAKCIN